MIEKDVRDPDTGKRRCTATNREGERCKRPPIQGGNVCNIHGGGAPQVRRKANLRLATLVEPAIAVLARTLVDPTARHSDRLRAAENVLDRAGYPRRVETMENTTAREILLARLEELRARGREPNMKQIAGPDGSSDDHSND